MALAIDASSPTSVSATGRTVTTASFTPPANSLIVALAVVGDLTSVAETGAITDSVSSTWTNKKRQNTTGDGAAEIWMMDAGSSPAARTVTLTGTASQGGVQLSVLVFTGAKALASQTGASNATIGTTFAISVTATATGSYIVGSLVQTSTNVTLTANANSTTLKSTSDGTNGETYGTWRSTNTTSSTGAISTGYTNTAGTNVQAVAYEILVASGTAFTQTSSDSAGLADSTVFDAAITTSSDSAGLADSRTFDAAITTSSDSSGLSDSVTVVKAITGSDTGTATDSAALSVTSSAADTGSAVDASASSTSNVYSDTALDSTLAGDYTIQVRIGGAVKATYDDLAQAWTITSAIF